MTAIPAQTQRVADYLRTEQETGERYAFYNGRLEQMAGGSIPHNRISRNILVSLGALLAQRPDWEIFGSDQKIYLPKYNFYVYPDVVVVAGAPLQLEAEANAIINPLLIVEILSSSIEHYDRGQKFIEYQSLPSFREYVLLRQDIPEALVFFRESPDVWRSTETTGLDKTLYLASLEFTLEMAAVYYKVEC